MASLLIYLILICFFSSCNGKNKVSVSHKKSKESEILNISITNIQLINHQIILTGYNLNSVSYFKINDGSIISNLQIESQSTNNLVANTLSNIQLSSGKILDFVLSNAQASATFSVNFSLCDSILGGKSFNCQITPNDKDVLSFDANSGKWKPRALNGLSYQGTWDATTSLPSTTSAGDYYIVNIANGSYHVGDWIVFNGISFDRIDNSQSITSVFGRTGSVAAQKGDYNLTKLADVDLTTSQPTAGNFLKYDGTNWVPGIISPGGGGTVTQVNVSAPLSVTSSTTTPSISLTQATSTTNGYLSSSDWTTFNNKQSLIASGSNTQYYRGDKTWADLATDIRSAALTGLSTLTSTAITAADSVVSALGKLQSQITSQDTTISRKADQSNTTQSITAATITGLVTPIAGSDATNKNYVDSFWSISGNDLYRPSGKIGIGGAPTARLEVLGDIVSTYPSNNTTATIDWSKGNLQTSDISTGAFTFSNLVSGGSYSLIITNTTNRTFSFTSTGFTFNTGTLALTTTGTSKVIFTFLVTGTTVYVMMNQGY